MKYDPYDAPIIELVEATLALSWEEVCHSSDYATQCVLLEFCIN